MLGDAYMHILQVSVNEQNFTLLIIEIKQPEKSIEIYEQTVKKNPKDSTLVRKVGQALIKAHFYERAVTYYKAAIKSSGQMPSYCYDLAELLHRLGRDDQCKEIIGQTTKLFDVNKSQLLLNFEFSMKKYGIFFLIDEMDIDTHIIKIRIFNLLAKVHKRSGDKGKAIQILRDAHDENQK